MLSVLAGDTYVPQDIVAIIDLACYWATTSAIQPGNNKVSVISTGGLVVDLASSAGGLDKGER